MTENLRDAKTFTGETYALVKQNKFSRIENLEDKDFSAWLNSELTYWEKIDKLVRQQKNLHVHARASDQSFELISRYRTEIQSLAQNDASQELLFDERGELTIAQRFIDINLKYNLPLHDDPLAENFKTGCISGGTDSCIYSYQLFSGEVESHYSRGYNEGIKKNLSNISEMYDKKISETIAIFNEQQGKISETSTKAEEAIEKLVAAGTAAISLSEPVKFWDERKLIHKQNAIKYGKYASRSGTIFAAALIAVVLYEYLSGIPHQVFGYDFTLPKSLSGIAIILLTSTAGIWSTRIFVKLMMANLTLETESIERSTMIKTFVAMKATEASIAQEAELLFYTTLFRPSNNVISEDSTAPEFGKVLDAILRVKTDKPAGS